MFIDNEFKANLSSLVGNCKDEFILKEMKKITWDRPEENSRIFIGNAHCYEIRQGMLNNSWFLVSLCLISSNDTIHLSKLISRLGKGKYQVKLYYGGSWNNIIIDSYLPYFHYLENGIKKKKIAFSSSINRKELWISFFEKALAKLYGNYYALSFGKITNGLRHLSGGYSDTVKLNLKLDNKVVIKKKLWNFLKDNFMHNCMMSLSRMDGNREDVYSIIEVHEKKKYKHTYRLVNIRNPWGKYHVKGFSSDKIIDLDEMEKSDGSFWIDLDIIYKHWDFLYICKVFSRSDLLYLREGEWNPILNKINKINKSSPKKIHSSVLSSRRIKKNNTDITPIRTIREKKYYMEHNPSYKITITTVCTLYVTLEKVGNLFDNGTSIGLHIAKGFSKSPYTFFTKSSVENQDHSISEVDFRPGTYYLKISGILSKCRYHICVYGDTSIQMIKLK